MGAEAEADAHAADDADRAWRAVELLDAVLDPDSFTSWDEPIDLSGPSRRATRRPCVQAAEKSGVDEAVITGRGRIAGVRSPSSSNEFDFLAGSIGGAAAGRLLAAISRATSRTAAAAGIHRSGGTRMQEGTPAFVKMVDIARALTEHKAAGLPYLVHLRHPTTGGVFASWGSLGHITVAEPAP